MLKTRGLLLIVIFSVVAMKMIEAKEEKPIIFSIEKNGGTYSYRIDGENVRMESMLSVVAERIPNDKKNEIIFLMQSEVPFSVVYNLKNVIEKNRIVSARYFVYNKKSKLMREYIRCENSTKLSTIEFPSCKMAKPGRSD